MTRIDGLRVRPMFCLPPWALTHAPLEYRDQSLVTLIRNQIKATAASNAFSTTANVKIAGAPDADEMRRKLSSV